ncbi:VOC family protein [Streptomyces ipomoeae]|uniref:VOC family protein n=1 Tax=Streptomyces ipomoeae TaxID=103232 RepID=UPI0015F11B09|nr:VOC family protein [Streptomyces ipomoeae]MDX2937771.1 VOC family protein [Streptomyces ipomoeae]
MRFGHLGVNVSHLERSVAWYAVVLGAHPTRPAFTMPDGTRVQFLAAGPFEIEMIEPAVQLPAAVDADAAPASFHVGVTVTDTDHELARLRESGLERVSGSEPAGGATSFRVRGPDGELFRFAAHDGHHGGPKVDHLGFNVSDLNGTAAWVERYFGLAASDLPSPDLPEGWAVKTLPVRPASVEMASGPGQDPTAVRRPPSLQQVGSWHLCLDVEDPAAVLEDMSAAGETIVIPFSELAPGQYHFFSRGPDGVLVQVRTLR